MTTETYVSILFGAMLGLTVLNLVLHLRWYQRSVKLLSVLANQTQFFGLVIEALKRHGMGLEVEAVVTENQPPLQTSRKTNAQKSGDTCDA